ncbi:glycosyltransferase family 2 protein [Aridibaculum aurantiacum]|uniref:glycosyltransferase family 2 protein n=1 Tax=Aridibaculum aurantiacum TaxID=2810307 RepID=UPI001A9783E6|nr:glycosyltransferase [Aridibaculum aurantiacum]
MCITAECGTIKISIITSIYKGEKFLAHFLDHLKRIENCSESEIIFVHNDPSEEELSLIQQFIEQQWMKVKHLIVPREGLYCSWNRGISAADGKYITIWNIDDVRLPDSLKLQSIALDQNPSSFLTYGNFKIVNNYGQLEGFDVIVPEYNKSNSSFRRRHHGGSFIMWRKDLHEKIGYFDEQFKLIADFDFQIRVCHAYPIVKTNHFLGYFLAGTSTNLSSNYLLQDIEHTALHLRYGNLDLVKLPTILSTIKQVKISQYRWFGNFCSTDNYSIHPLKNLLFNFPLIVIPVIYLPRHLARQYLKKRFPSLSKIKKWISLK